MCDKSSFFSIIFTNNSSPQHIFSQEIFFYHEFEYGILKEREMINVLLCVQLHLGVYRTYKIRENEAILFFVYTLQI